MFIRAIKFNRKTAVILIVAAALILCGIILSCAKPAGADVGTTDGRVAYLAGLGWETDPESEEREVIVLPREFEGVMRVYNEMQLAQGFDLSRYAGRECERYTYRVTNYPNGDPNVLAQLFICGSRVIGGDIHTTAMDGFMHGIK
jgi:hypothetical protein